MMVAAELDVVIPVFNEIEIVEQLHSRVVAACEETRLRYRIIYVDDGSSDGTPDWIAENALTNELDPNLDRLPIQSFRQSNGHVTLLELSRNFGQPSAILAGLQHSQGGCVVIMDGDLQDPPELIPKMVKRWESGDQVVIAQRTSRQETFVRGLAFKTFHKSFRFLADSSIPPNTGTFCLLDRTAADSICELPESHRFFPGLRLDRLPSVHAGVPTPASRRWRTQTDICPFAEIRARCGVWIFFQTTALTDGRRFRDLLCFVHPCQLVFAKAGAWFGDGLHRFHHVDVCGVWARRISADWVGDSR